MNPRKSLGGIWGSISSRVSPRREHDLFAAVGGANQPTNMANALELTPGQSVTLFDKLSDGRVLTLPLNRDSKFVPSNLAQLDLILHR
jgi:hypothetical protein